MAKKLNTVAFVSENPKNLPGGYDETDGSNRYIMQKLEEGIRRAASTGVTNFISSGRTGPEMWAAEAVLRLKGEFPEINLQLASPKASQVKAWPKEAQDRFSALQQGASQTLSARKGYKELYLRSADAFISVHSGMIEEGENANNQALEILRNAEMRKKGVYNINPHTSKASWGDAGHRLGEITGAIKPTQPSGEAYKRANSLTTQMFDAAETAIEDKKNAIEQILGRADVSKPYGVLEYMNAERSKGQVEVEGSVQERLAMSARAIYEQAHKNYLDRYPGADVSYNDFVTKIPGIRKEVAGLSVNLQGITGAMVGEKTIGQIHPMLQTLRTVGDVENYLFNSVRGGFMEMAGKVAGGAEKLDVLGEMEMGYWEKAPLYQQTVTSESGKTVNVPYQNFAQKAAFSSGKRFARSEKKYSNLFSGLPEDDEEPVIENGVYADETPVAMDGASGEPAVAQSGWLDNLANLMDPEDKELTISTGSGTRRFPHKGYQRKYNSNLYTVEKYKGGGPFLGMGTVPLSAAKTDEYNTPVYLGRQDAEAFKSLLAANEQNPDFEKNEGMGMIRRSLNRIGETLSNGGGGDASEPTIEEFDALAGTAARTDEHDLLLSEFNHTDKEANAVLGEDPILDKKDTYLQRRMARDRLVDEREKAVRKSRTWMDADASDIGSRRKLDDAYRAASAPMQDTRSIAARAGRLTARNAGAASVKQVLTNRESSASAAMNSAMNKTMGSSVNAVPERGEMVDDLISTSLDRDLIEPEFDTNPAIYNQGMTSEIDRGAITGRNIAARRPHVNTDPILGGDRFSEGSGRARRLDSMPVSRRMRRADPAGNDQPPMPEEPPDILGVPPEDSDIFGNEMSMTGPSVAPRPVTPRPTTPNSRQTPATVPSGPPALLHRLSVRRNVLEMSRAGAQNDAARSAISAKLLEVDAEALGATSSFSDEELRTRANVTGGQNGNFGRFLANEWKRRFPDVDLPAGLSGDYGAEARLGADTITDPADFPRHPQALDVLKYTEPGEDGQPGRSHVLEARTLGTGPSARRTWAEQDAQGNYHRAENPGYGQITNTGEVVADVSREQHEQYENTKGQMQGERETAARIRGRRDMTPEEYAQDRARSVKRGSIMHSKRMGMGNPKEIDAQHEIYSMVSKSDESIEVASSETVSRAYAAAQTGAAKAFSGSLPSGPAEKIATIRQRILDYAAASADDFVKEQLKTGVDPNIARVNGERFRQISMQYAKNISQVVGASLGVDYDVSASEVSAVQYNKPRPRSLEEVKNLLDKSPMARGMLNGRSAEEIWKAGESFAVTDEQGYSYDIGSQGKYNKSGADAGNRQANGMGGLWGGKLGSAMYGAYMLTRGWNMAAGPAVQQAEAYTKSLSGLAFTLPEGSFAGSSSAGMTSRQQLGDMYMGQAAYETFGPLMNINYNLGKNPATARAITSAKAAGTVAFDAGIAGSMMGMMGGPESAMAAAGKALGTAGLVVAGGIMAGTGAMEGYNAWFKQPGHQDLTWSNAWAAANSGFEHESAGIKLADARFGANYDSRPAGARRMTQEEWAKARQDFQFSESDYRSAMTKGEADWYFGDQPDSVREASTVVGNISDKTGELFDPVAAGISMQKRLLGSYTQSRGMEISRIALSRGMSSEQQISEAAQYAGAMGFYEGTPDFTSALDQYNQASERSPLEAAKLKGRAGMISQYGSQLMGLFGPDDQKSKQTVGIGSSHGAIMSEISLPEEMVARFNMNQVETGITSSYLQTIQEFGGEITPYRMEQAASFATTTSPYVAKIANQAMGAAGVSGMSSGQLSDIGSMVSNLDAEQATMFSQILGGDMRAASFQSWKNDNGYAGRLYDQAGNNIWETNGNFAMKWLRGNLNTPTAQKLGLSEGMSDRSMASIVTGSSNNRILDAFMQDGTRGIDALSRIDQANASAALAGIQMRGLELQENFMWGDNSGGTWNNPAAHSAWGIEDQLRSNQHASTMAGFVDQKTRMDLSNDYAVRREDNQAQRMNATNEFSQWQWGASYSQAQQRQEWGREDWQYQDTTRSLNNGWQMEDLNEAIRFSSGRERKQLLKQRDRAALTQNLEGEQIETQRERQEELWAQEDERFRKQKEYMDETQRLDRESFDLNKEQRETFFKLDEQSYARRIEEYLAEKKLNDEMTELNRKYQFDQIQLQKEAAAVQAGAAAAQREYAEAMLKANQNLGDAKGELEQINSYDNSFRLIAAMRELFSASDKLSTYKIDKAIAFMNTLSTLSTTSQPWGGERE